jgi:hypothetical protein
LVKMAPNGPADPGVINFGVTMANFCTHKIMIVTIGSKANKCSNIFLLLHFSNF